MSSIDANRWRMVRDILYQAMELPEKDREAFLVSACGADRELRREVDELLRASEGTLAEIDTDAGGDDGPMLAAGQILGHYRVLRLIGKGGMGAVYDAEDLTLHRRVALKILGRESRSEKAAQRFAREARAASSLNHPGIVTVYEFASAGDVSFIAMEFVEGDTLREMAGAPLPVALEWMRQVADALAAAHRAGVVHRDLKPGNIMVTPAGQVKVLDFGLARRAKEWSDPAASKNVASQNVTMTGELLGTPAYMSPEQALGEAVGTASDIFSFGIILYEIACGSRPFEGNTPMATLQQVLQCAPAPPRRLNGKIRPDLAALIEHCLERQPEARPASIADVADALRNLSKALDTAGSAITARYADRKLLRRPVKRGWIRWAGVAVAALALAGGAYWAGLVRHRRVAGEITGAPEITRVTFDSGLNIDPSISADGKFVAYSSDRSGDGNLDIWVQQIGGGSPIRLTRDPTDDKEPDISPDGTHVVYRSDRNGGGIYIVPMTGGEERRIADGGRRPKYSPDGSKVLYWTGPDTHYPPKDGVGEIFVVDLTRSTARRIRPDFTVAVDPIWSPDGEKILFVGAKQAVAKDWGWWLTPLDAGEPVRCPAKQEEGGVFVPFAWRGDWVYFEWAGKQPQAIGRMAVDAASGRVLEEPQRVSAGTGDAMSPSVSRSGQMAFSVWDASRSLYSLALDPNEGKPKSLTRLSKEPGLNMVRSISTDGTRLVFTSERFSGKYLQVWVRDLVTGVERAVTAGNESKGFSVISPDGRSIAWRSAYGNVRGIFLTPFEGGPARVLCSDCNVPRAWSPDGKFLLYDRMDGRSSIGILETSGKARPYLAAANLTMRASSLSNDGKWMAFLIQRGAVDFTVYVAPFAPDRPPPASEWVKIAESPEVHPDPQWSPDANLLYFTSERDGYNCIWAMRLNHRTKRPEGQLFAVRHFHDPARALAAPSSKYVQFPLARDKIAITLRESSGGIWMTKVEPAGDGNNLRH